MSVEAGLLSSCVILYFAPSVVYHVFLWSVIFIYRFFFYEDSEDSKVVKNIGNVTVDSEISFEYGVRTNSVEGKKSMLFI